MKPESGNLKAEALGGGQMACGRRRGGREEAQEEGSGERGAGSGEPEGISEGGERGAGS
jgi:hypothetical protein